MGIHLVDAGPIVGTCLTAPVSRRFCRPWPEAVAGPPQLGHFAKLMTSRDAAGDRREAMRPFLERYPGVDIPGHGG